MGEKKVRGGFDGVKEMRGEIGGEWEVLKRGFCEGEK